MKQKILIVEDEFIVANNLSLILTKANYEICGIAASVDEAIILVEKFNPTWVLLDIFLGDGSQGTDLASFLRTKGIAFIYISANTNQSILEVAKATQPYGFLVKPFRERDLLMMLDIAYEKHLQNLQVVQQQENLVLKQLDLLTSAPLDTMEKLSRLSGILQALLPFDLMRLKILKNGTGKSAEVTLVRTGFDEYRLLTKQDLTEQLGFSGQFATWFENCFDSDNFEKLYNGNDYTQLLETDSCEKLLSKKYQLESKIIFSIELENSGLAHLSFYSRNPDRYIPDQIVSVKKANNELARLLMSLNVNNNELNNIGAFPETYDKLIPAKNTAAGLGEIIGNSPILLSVLDKVSLVAPTPSSVLILGDSGTGKEKIAQCIHKLSDRKAKPIVTVNCAALPKDLIESELFGHEKGAFTGAIEKRIGKFELAEGGTIFLDEIGELPLDAQVKLLRVLQEREIEPVGGSKSIKVNVRVIAATNRKLEKEVAEGRFRLDLYYRLNVFPIELPALRERKSDIPLLAIFFVQKFCRQMGKEPLIISKLAMSQLQSYDWPGNIRELEHLLERSLVINSGTTIENIIIPTKITEMLSASGLDHKIKTLEELETDHILSVLKSCKGKIGGAGGAAEILGIPASTLNSKIKKLGIYRESYFNL